MDEFGDGNALLMGGEKVKSCSFDGPPGIVWEGIVLEEPRAVQQRDYDNEEELLWWDEAKTKPKLSLVIKIQTNVTDPHDPDDTGVRALWVKGNSQKAIVAAVRAAGANGVKVGGHLVLDYYDAVETPPKPGENSRKKRYPTKMYRASYTPPPSAGNQALMASTPDTSYASGPAPTQASDLRQVAAQQSAVMAAMRGANHQGRPQDSEPPF